MDKLIKKKKAQTRFFIIQQFEFFGNISKVKGTVSLLLKNGKMNNSVTYIIMQKAVQWLYQMIKK